MREIRKYYRQIAGWLPCGGVCKRMIMDRIRANVDAYLVEHPDADMEEIQSRFGGPKEIAAAYVSDLDAGELLAALRVRRRVLATVLAVVMFVVVSWGACVLWAVELERRTVGGHTEDAIIEGVWQEGVDYDEFFE